MIEIIGILHNYKFSLVLPVEREQSVKQPRKPEHKQCSDDDCQDRKKAGT